MRHHLKFLAGFALIFAMNAKAATAEKDWNFLIFLNGINNLDDDATMNLKQMEEVGSNDRLNIVVQWGSASRPSVDRLLVQKTTNPDIVSSPVVQSLGAVDMGSANSVVDFVNWAQANYPSKKTFLAIWDHGGGWHIQKPGNHGTMSPQDISWDDHSGNHITTEQLGHAMRQIRGILGHKVDVYGSDACLMGMAEVADQMGTAVDYYVGSQDTEPGAGWPYNSFLKAWTANMEMTPKDVAALLANEYVKAYNPGGVYGDQGQQVTLAAYDLSQMVPFRKSIYALTKKLMSASDAQIQAMKTAAATAKSFQQSEDYKDLIDLLDKTGMDTFAPAESAAVRAAHGNLVIANGQNQDQVTHGLSIWLPSEQYNYTTYQERYSNLLFSEHTHWGDFVQRMNK